MKKLFVLAVASLIATSASAAEMKWNGSAGWRYNQNKHDDGLNSVVSGTTGAGGKGTSIQTDKSHAMRANLGVTGGWENIEWGMGMRTTGARNTDYVNVTSAGDQVFGLEQAWFRYLKDFNSVNMSLTIGRQKNVFAYDMGAQSLFDNDVRFDGFGWNFKFGMFGLNLGQYVTGAKNQGGQASSAYTKTEATEAVASTHSKFNSLIGFQPTMNWKFADEIEAMFAVGYFAWSDEANTNATGGGRNSSALNGAGTTVPALANANFNIHNPRQWQFLTSWTLPYSLAFTGELIMNAKSKALYSSATLPAYTTGNAPVGVSKTAYALGLTYGKLRKAHDFMASYTFARKGIASVIGAYSNDLFAPDQKGHILTVGYNLADNFTLGAAAYLMKEVEKKNVTGAVGAVTGAAGTAYAGANASQAQSNRYWELTAGVSF
ncbi:MAG: hypothetical protein ACXWQO_05260 [Bdellovibrionota bacterium]